MADNQNNANNYSASNIQVLEGLEAVRKRPAMYIGDISEKGLHHLVNETVDNSIDEAMAGYCTDIEVTINEDNSITVEDNGRGIPVDMHEKLHKSALEVVMTVLHAGGKQGIPIEIAVMYNTDYSENIHSYVNNINTIEGGTHLTGFRMALTRTLKAYAEADPTISKQIEKAKVEIAPEDFREGLTAVISIKVAEPQFEGQTKTKLGNSEVQGAVQQAVNEALADYLEEHPDEAKRICEKVVLAATARIAARKARESVQRKNFMTGGGLPGKLADCSMKDPKECEIFLVEGDSAGGSAKQGRDRFRQAILPLRGKILNVEKVQWHKVFEAESVMNIIQSIGVRFGVDGEDSKEANTDKLRYDKIIIMTDADVDGSHIDTLIMTLFYRFMPKVIEEGHLYIATPPLYKCTYRNKVSEYCYTEQQRQAFIDKYGEGLEDKNIHTQRYKGLGEMNPEQLWETTMDPSTRLLKQVTIDNAAQADEIFSMLMGDDVEPRREFIEQNATYANIDA